MFDYKSGGVELRNLNLKKNPLTHFQLALEWVYDSEKDYWRGASLNLKSSAIPKKNIDKTRYEFDIHNKSSNVILLENIGAHGTYSGGEIEDVFLLPGKSTIARFHLDGSNDGGINIAAAAISQENYERHRDLALVGAASQKKLMTNSSNGSFELFGYKSGGVELRNLNLKKNPLTQFQFDIEWVYDSEKDYWRGATLNLK